MSAICLEATVRHILNEVGKHCKAELELLETTLPVMIDKTPSLSLTQAF